MHFCCGLRKESLGRFAVLPDAASYEREATLRERSDVERQREVPHFKYERDCAEGTFKWPGIDEGVEIEL